MIHAQKNIRDHQGPQVKTAEINPLVKEDVTNLISSMGATRAVNALQTHYSANSDDDNLNALPTSRQATNYKRNIITSTDPYRTYAGVNEHMYDRRVTTKSDFKAISNLDKLIYLRGYNSICEDLDNTDKNEKENAASTFGFVITTKSYLTM